MGNAETRRGLLELDMNGRRDLSRRRVVDAIPGKVGSVADNDTFEGLHAHIASKCLGYLGKHSAPK
jgi:hypothetical protein